MDRDDVEGALRAVVVEALEPARSCCRSSGRRRRPRRGRPALIAGVGGLEHRGVLDGVGGPGARRRSRRARSRPRSPRPCRRSCCGRRSAEEVAEVGRVGRRDGDVRGAAVGPRGRLGDDEERLDARGVELLDRGVERVGDVEQVDVVGRVLVAASARRRSTARRCAPYLAPASIASVMRSGVGAPARLTPGAAAWAAEGDGQRHERRPAGEGSWGGS